MAALVLGLAASVAELNSWLVTAVMPSCLPAFKVSANVASSRLRLDIKILAFLENYNPSLLL